MTNGFQLSGPSPDGPGASGDDDLDLEMQIPGYYSLHCDLLAKSFYHDERLRFFLFTTGAFLVFGMVTTSGTFAHVVQPFPWVQTGLGLTSVIAQAISFAFGVNNSASFHRQKKEKYALLLGELQGAKSEKDVRRVERAASKEYATESVVYWCVEVLAWNRAYLSVTATRDVDERELYPVTFWERRFRNLRGYSLEHFRKRKLLNVERLNQIEEQRMAVRH
jgi:hypothetical protein